MDSIYAAENRIEKLKKRAQRCVCRYCGGQLQLRQIVFNDIDEARVEIFCEDCDAIEFGVEPAVYKTARDFVDNFEFNMFEDMDQNAKTRKMNIAKVCDILAWGCTNMGILSKEGFLVPVKLDEEETAELVIQQPEEIDGEKDFDQYLEEFSCRQ